MKVTTLQPMNKNNGNAAIVHFLLEWKSRNEDATFPAVSAGPPCTGNTVRSTWSGLPRNRSSSAGGAPVEEMKKVLQAAGE